MIKTLFWLLVLFSVSSNSFAAEQEDESEPVTVKELLFYDLEELTSVSFFDTEVKKAPGYSYIITSDQIENSADDGRTRTARAADRDTGSIHRQ